VVPVDGNQVEHDHPADRAQRRLYGRGAADMRVRRLLPLAVPDMLAARSRPIHSRSVRREVGHRRAQRIAPLERAKVKPAACFVGEPTEWAW
jgi:acetylornithine deacetylase/succinyl-diaminopimelate desuccinylase-like protein